MTPQELRASILDLAIQGKLVPQIPEEGTGENLYEQIKMVDAQECSGKRRGKGKSIILPISEDDIPFDVPETWKWVRLGTIGYTNIGLTYSPKDIADDGTIVLRSSNIQNDRMDYEDIVRVKMDIPKNKMCHIGDILICARNGSKRLVGKAAIIDKEGMSFGAFMAIFRSPCNEYVLQFINSAYFRNSLLGDTGTTTINQITQDMLKNALIPLPPLAEQKRIVAKIEELLPLIDRYEQAWSALETFNTRFPVEMQKSILQMAIQGKLVPQLPEEGTGEELFQQIQAGKQTLVKAGKIKKEKPLPEITEDEIPFDIPDSWKWVRFSDVLDVRDGTHDTPKYVTSGIPLVTSKNLVDGKIDFETTKMILLEDAQAINMRSAVDDGDILFAMIGTIGNPVLVNKDREFCIKNMALFKAIDQDLFSMEYLLLFLQNEQHAMKKKASGGVQSFVSLKFLRNYLLPLPPLAEQKRIVAKLEEILPLCERLK